MNVARVPGRSETVAAWRAGLLDRLIADVLEPVIGEPFMDLGRAADLIWLGFGEKVGAPTRRDPERRTARHRLHVMCPFRLDSNDAILVAASDIYRPVGAADSIENFDWDKPGANLFDASVANFWSDHQPGFAVLDRVGSDTMGGLHLELSSGHTIRIFPNRSGTSEHWRYFAIDAEDHFVVVPDNC
jgi:hypothetical protein